MPQSLFLFECKVAQLAPFWSTTKRIFLSSARRGLVPVKISTWILFDHWLKTQFKEEKVLKLTNTSHKTSEADFFFLFQIHSSVSCYFSCFEPIRQSGCGVLLTGLRHRLVQTNTGGSTGFRQVSPRFITACVYEKFIEKAISVRIASPI